MVQIGLELLDFWLLEDWDCRHTPLHLASHYLELLFLLISYMSHTSSITC